MGSDLVRPLADVERRKFKGAAILRYAVVDGGPSASRLVVILPRLKGGNPSKLDRELAQELVSTGQHLLLAGADRDLFYGPGRRARGLETVAQLVTEEAERRGVPLGGVTVVGRQFGGSIALWTASRVPVGRVIAGRAPIRLGRFLASMAGRRDDVESVDALGSEQADADQDDSSNPAAAGDVPTAQPEVGAPGPGADLLENPKLERWLDRAITRDLIESGEHTRFDLFADGKVGREMTRLHHELARNERIVSTLVEASPDGPDFFSFARAKILGDAGTNG